MLTQPSAAGQLKSKAWAIAASRATIILLLFTVAGLATFAKNGQYYPESNPAQHVSVSIKMNVTHSLVQATEEPLQPVSRFLPPQPSVPSPQVRAEATSPSPPVGITVSMQHRSPPPALPCSVRLSSLTI